MKKYIYILVILFGCNGIKPEPSEFDKKVEKLGNIKSLYADVPNFREVWHLNPDSLIDAFSNAYKQNQDSANAMFRYYDSLYTIARSALLQLNIDQRKAEIQANKKPEAKFIGKPLKSESYIISQSAIKQRLKAPSTAKFPRGSDFSYSFITPNQHKVISYVDSQNSFGAMIRTNYTIILEFNGGEWADGRNWKVISVDFY